MRMKSMRGGQYLEQLLHALLESPKLRFKKLNAGETRLRERASKKTPKSWCRSKRSLCMEQNKPPARVAGATAKPVQSPQDSGLCVSLQKRELISGQSRVKQMSAGSAIIERPIVGLAWPDFTRLETMSLLKQVTPAGIDCCCVWLPIAKVATRWVRKQAAAKAIQRSQSGSQSICGNLASDTSQNMTAAMPKNVKAGGMMLALLMAVVTFTAADCPDAGIRCRIPASDADTTFWLQRRWQRFRWSYGRRAHWHD
ncbi:hypothetical protein WJX82_001926 [Trebouxia sp. C0006]